MSDEYSSGAPRTAPMRLAPSATPGSSAFWNDREDDAGEQHRQADLECGDEYGEAVAEPRV